MPGRADTTKHLSNRRDNLRTFFDEWNQDLTPSGRADAIEGYFKEAGLAESQRVGSGQSVFVPARNRVGEQTTVLVAGRHDVDDLASGRTGIVTDASLVGPGVASRLGPTVAFCEGVQATQALTGDDRIAVSYLSLGNGDALQDLASIVTPSSYDCVFLTNAACWSPHHPTITTGARGQLVAEVSLQANTGFDDFTSAGALRNPLTKLTQILASLRDDSGKIVLPNFYEQALAPSMAARASLAADDHDPNAWSEHIDAARFGGSLSSLERVALWPGLSIVAVNGSDASVARAPARASATIAFYLVPDQRYSVIESSLRSWFQEAAPPQLRPSVRVLTSNRPVQAELDGLAVAAQTRAARRLFGNAPIHVPAGGGVGTGEAAFSIGSPVGFAGIAPPSSSTSTDTEALSWTHFEAGVAMAAETILQLRRAQ